MHTAALCVANKGGCVGATRRGLSRAVWGEPRPALCCNCLPCVCWQLHQKWPRPNGGPSNCAVALDVLLVPHCSAMGWWILDALLAPWWWATHNGAMEHVTGVVCIDAQQHFKHKNYNIRAYHPEEGVQTRAEVVSRSQELCQQSLATWLLRAAPPSKGC